MNRDIKFRAFYKGKILYDVAIINGYLATEDNPEAENNYVKVINRGLPHYYYDDWAKYKVKKDAILMQFTGVKDKNGKEIYEGDIVIHKFNPGNHIVEYCKDSVSFQMDMSNCVLDQEMGCGYDSVEIIGNIHENPNLLNLKK